MDLSITTTVDELQDSLGEYSGSTTKASEDSIRVLKSSQLYALESLAALLLREVELLKENEDRIARRINNEEGIDLYKEVQNFEANMIRSALIRARGVQRKAAELLGVKVTTLNVKIKRYKINFDPERST